MSVTITPQSVPVPSNAQQAQQKGQTSTVEGIVPPQAEATIAPETLSPRFAALARKEKESRIALQQVRQQQAALKAKEEEYKTKYIPRDRFQTDTLAALKDVGLSYDQITQLQLNQANPVDPTIQALQDKIAELEAGQKQVKTQFEESSNAQYQQAIKQITSDVNTLVESNEQFETIKALGQSEAVVALIEETFKEEGRLMTLEDAATAVEDYLVEEAMKMASLNKIKLKMTPPLPVEQTQKPIQQQRMNTLTSAVSATTTSRLSEKERIERAKLAFRNELK